MLHVCAENLHRQHLHTDMLVFCPLMAWNIFNISSGISSLCNFLHAPCGKETMAGCDVPKLHCCSDSIGAIAKLTSMDPPTADLGGQPVTPMALQSLKTSVLVAIWVVVKIMAPFLGTLNNRCRIIIGTQKGTIILTTTHMLPTDRNNNNST